MQLKFVYKKQNRIEKSKRCSQKELLGLCVYLERHTWLKIRKTKAETQQLWFFSFYTNNERYVLNKKQYSHLVQELVHIEALRRKAKLREQEVFSNGKEKVSQLWYMQSTDKQLFLISFLKA